MENILLCPLAPKPDIFEMMIESFGVVVIPPNMMSLYLTTEYLPMQGGAARDTYVVYLIHLWADAVANIIPCQFSEVFFAHSQESSYFWISYHPISYHPIILNGARNVTFKEKKTKAPKNCRDLCLSRSVFLKQDCK